MFGTKYNKFLTVLLIIIIVAIIGLLGFLGFNYFKNYSIKNDANQFVSSFSEESGQSGVNSGGDSGDGFSEGIESTEVGSSGKKVKTYKGHEIIGAIEIPKTKINYPIFKDPPTVEKLELSVSSIYPENADLTKPGNVVIIGHNYRNGSFFSDNKKLAKGDKIYLTDLDGNKISYSVYNVFIATKDDTSFYNRDTDGAREITLSTCADDSTNERVIVEAKAD